MIPNFLNSSNKNKGGSLMSPANGLGGSRATILFSFPKAAAVPALRALKQAGKKWKGVEGGGKLFARERFIVSACSSEQNAETKFSSSLIEKNGRARNPKIREENFVEA